MKTALIKSIRDGVFFDRKYWARHSKVGDVLKPVYFSSTIMGDKSQQLKKRGSKFFHDFVEALNGYPVVNYLKSQNTLINDLNENLNVESDCESNPTGVSYETPGEKEKEEIRAVLITGSFSACVHFLTSPPGREK